VSEALARQPLTETEARRITDQVKRDAEHLWQRLVLLYEGKAHEALGYSSWGAYFEAEFGGTKRRGYQLLEAGRVLETVQNFALPSPANDAQARELAPLLGSPEELREAWGEVVELHPGPTAADVRAVVRNRTSGAKAPVATDPRFLVSRALDRLEVELEKHESDLDNTYKKSVAELLRRKADRLDPPPPARLFDPQQGPA
jgi:hypothetical protein